MKKIFLIVFLTLFTFSAFAQRTKILGTEGQLFKSDSTSFQNEVEIKLDGTTKYTDYKIISVTNDTTVIDTTLTLKKDFKFNYLRKDDFELIAFHNQGQTFNKLGYNFENSSLIPSIGASSKHYNYYKVEDINYYYVPTPSTEIMYRTGLEQGQVLDAFLTMNTSRQFNFSFSYKGLRSLGKYRNALASHGNFRSTFNYHSKNKTYFLKGHFSSFDILNNENGGLTQQSIGYFENNDSNYTERARLEVNYTNANNLFEGKRYYMDQTITLFSKKTKIENHNTEVSNRFKKYNFYLKRIEFLKKDTVNDNSKMIDSIAVLASLSKTDSSQFKSVHKNLLFDFKLGHSFMYETQHYRFNQTAANTIFGDAFNSTISDHTSYQKSNNQVYLQLNSPIVGSLKAKANYFTYNYHYNSILYYNTQTIPDKLKGNAIAVGADWDTNYGNIYLNADASSIITGDLTGSSIKASISFKKDSIFSFKGFAEITTKSPDFNKLLFQSDYKDYNWQNNFKNEDLKIIGAEINFTKWGSIEASYNLIDNYTYFNENSTPVQANETLNYLKLKVNNAVTFRKFTLENTVQYQTVPKGESFFNVPELITRNTLYFSSFVFKGSPMYLQTGVTFKYFTAFKANAYNPLLSEFVLQNTTDIGNFPLLDFFANAQIQRTRIYLKVENFSASFTGRKYYAAPNYPYRDLTVRFGLVWNWFI